jgi:hypothetical protein
VAGRALCTSDVSNKAEECCWTAHWRGGVGVGGGRWLRTITAGAAAAAKCIVGGGTRSPTRAAGSVARVKKSSILQGSRLSRTIRRSDSTCSDSIPTYCMYDYAAGSALLVVGEGQPTPMNHFPLFLLPNIHIYLSLLLE